MRVVAQRCVLMRVLTCHMFVAFCAENTEAFVKLAHCCGCRLETAPVKECTPELADLLEEEEEQRCWWKRASADPHQKLTE